MVGFFCLLILQNVGLFEIDTIEPAHVNQNIQAILMRVQ